MWESKVAPQVQAATSTIFHEGFGVPINVLEGANEGKDVWIGFSSGDIAIMNIGAKTVGTRWKAHPGGVSCIVALNDTVWSGDHYVQNFFQHICSNTSKSIRFASDNWCYLNI